MAAGDNFGNSRHRMFLAIDPISRDESAYVTPIDRGKTGRARDEEIGFQTAIGFISIAEPSRITQFAGIKPKFPIELKFRVAICLSAEQHKTVSRRTCTP